MNEIYANVCIYETLLELTVHWYPVRRLRPDHGGHVVPPQGRAGRVPDDCLDFALS